MRGVWQPAIKVIPVRKVNRESRETLRQFVEPCRVVEAGSAADAGEVYRVYERWAAAGGKRSVMKLEELRGVHDSRWSPDWAGATRR